MQNVLKNLLQTGSRYLLVGMPVAAWHHPCLEKDLHHGVRYHLRGCDGLREFGITIYDNGDMLDPFCCLSNRA